jgi:nitrogen-specific signal transduction histidine kinase
MNNSSLTPTRPLCILHSEDAELRHRLAALLNERAYVCHAPDERRLEELLGGNEPVLLFIDLRAPSARELTARLARIHPHAVGIGLGVENTEPFRAAQDAGLYLVESLDADRARLQDVIDRTVERVGWMQETLLLRDELARLRSLQKHQQSGGGRGNGGRNLLGLQSLVKATRQLDPLEDLFEKIVDGVSSSAMVSRVGLFYRYDGEQNYRLEAARCCLEDTAHLELSDRDPLVRWLQRSPRLITRASLDHIADPSERALLRRSLDLLGAETFIPLNLRGRVLGWIFTGPTDGLPFDHNDHSELSFLSDQVVHSLENTIKHHEILSQKNLGENLLQMMPTAVVTADADGNITWCSAPAEKLFPALARGLGGGRTNRPPPKIPVEDLGSRVASLMRDALAGEPTGQPVVWESTAAGGRTLTVRTRQMLANGKCHGAVALVDDITDQLAADSQADQIERASFWRELAAGISHEIRNPLVAIKTFTQLLPQRHADENFRLEFKEMVTRELGRLDGIVSQIDNFAHPAATVIESFNLVRVLETAADNARAALEAPDAKITIHADEGLPEMRGDQRALEQTFQQLFVNAIEAARNKDVRAQIKARIIAHRIGGEIMGFKLAIADNGRGIAEELLGHVFSPFCTSKAQGLGLGLAMAQRVILDHGGRIELDSGTLGLCVNLTLPLAPPWPPGGPPRLPIAQAPAPPALPAPADERAARRLKYETRIRLGQ